MVKFERWNDILRPGFAEWETTFDEGKKQQFLAETMAYTGLGRLSAARERFRDLQDIDSKIRGGKDKGASLTVEIAEAMLLQAEGKHDLAEKALLRADEIERRDHASYPSDPPSLPWSVARLLGDFYRAKGLKTTAVGYYERALKYEPNDGFSLGGLALLCQTAGEADKGAKYAGRFAYTWSNADPELPLVKQVRAAYPTIQPIADTPAKERTYKPANLESFGPSNWQPFPAPKLEVQNINGKPVRLEDYRGRNVLLVFFLGEACVHCVGQLKSINDRMKDFQDQNTAVLAVCSASPKSLKESVSLNPVKVTFLSDNKHENARRFASYDDFEDMELHSTILIDKQGRVRWKRTGGDPFMNMDFLLKELRRVNKT